MRPDYTQIFKLPTIENLTERDREFLDETFSKMNYDKESKALSILQDKNDRGMLYEILGRARIGYYSKKIVKQGDKTPLHLTFVSNWQARKFLHLISQIRNTSTENLFSTLEKVDVWF